VQARASPAFTSPAREGSCGERRMSHRWQPRYSAPRGARVCLGVSGTGGARHVVSLRASELSSGSQGPPILNFRHEKCHEPPGGPSTNGMKEWDGPSRSCHHSRPTDDAFTPRIQNQVRGERRNPEPLFRCGGWAFDLSSGFLSRFYDASAQAQGACTSLDFKNRGTSIHQFDKWG
jgi:hypothetical protein